MSESLAATTALKTFIGTDADEGLILLVLGVGDLGSCDRAETASRADRRHAYSLGLPLDMVPVSVAPA